MTCALESSLANPLRSLILKNNYQPFPLMVEVE